MNRQSDRNQTRRFRTCVRNVVIDLPYAQLAAGKKSLSLTLAPSIPHHRHKKH
jgi:hypothetical protein